jgi:hypothetical protein
VVTLLNEQFMELMWERHCYDGFPRCISYPMPPQDRFRTPCRNFDNFKWHVWRGFGATNIYVDLYPEKMILSEDSIYCNKIYIDLDNDKADKTDRNGIYAYNDMRSIVRFFKDQYQYDPRVYYSGGRGYAIYLDFDQVLINHLKDTMTEFYVMLKDQLNLKCIDTTSVGDDRRISRLPYTMHKKSGRLCTPIDPSWSLTQIMGYSDSFIEDLAEQEVVIGNCDGFGPSLKHLDEVVEERIKEREERLKNAPPITFGHNGDAITIRYFDEVTWLHQVRQTYAEGRHRTLWCILVPRLLYLLSEGKPYKDLPQEKKDDIAALVEGRAMEWVLDTPVADPDGTPRKSDDNYRAYIRAIIRQHSRDDWHPWSLETFWLSNPDLVGYWKT